MIKVLHVVSSLGGGGVENMLYNYYSHIDRSKVKFDFVVHGDAVGMLEKKFQDLGSKVFHVTPKKLSLKKNIGEIHCLIKKGEYDVVHCHQNYSNFTSLFLAWKNNVPVRISHAHGCKEVNSVIEKARYNVLQFFNKTWANYYFSCGLKAGTWLHGKNWSVNEKNILMNNAIDLNKFHYNEVTRETYREQLNIKDKRVLLHVGRFSSEKNHLFMIDIIKELSNQSDEYILLLVGNGDLEEEVKSYVSKKGISEKVLFLGIREDIANLMNASDIFLLPSKHEGFPVTLIEAQSTGIKVIASDKVTKETAVTNLVEYAPIEDIYNWIQRITSIDYVERYSRCTEIKKAGYSIDTESVKYLELLKKQLVSSSFNGRIDG